MEHDLAASIASVRDAISSACRRAGRPDEGVRLVGASKSVPAEVIRAARQAGLEDFAENYARELARKAGSIEARWHFIGKLQRGTAATVAELADVVHTAEPGGGFNVLARRAAAAGRTLPCLIQVDFTGRRQGVAPDRVPAFLEEASATTGIRVVGLMTLPPPGPDAESARSFFRRLREIRDSLAEGRPDLRELSMGMSLDYSVAVEEGATMVRVGTGLFGPRPDAPG